MARSRLNKLLLSGLFAALIGVLSQVVIPLPFVPINLALFGVHLAGLLLGPLYGLFSVSIYLLMGILGVPVFASFGAGPGVLFGMTGGYLVGYALCVLIVGALSPRLFGGRAGGWWAAMLLGLLACYAFGTAWFMNLTGYNLVASLWACVIPFLPGDGVKMLLAALLYRRLKDKV